MVAVRRKSSSTLCIDCNNQGHLRLQHVYEGTPSQFASCCTQTCMRKLIRGAIRGCCTRGAREDYSEDPCTVVRAQAARETRSCTSIQPQIIAKNMCTRSSANMLRGMQQHATKVRSGMSHGCKRDRLEHSCWHCRLETCQNPSSTFTLVNRTEQKHEPGSRCFARCS
jgi:hypothetical protein